MLSKVLKYKTFTVASVSIVLMFGLCLATFSIFLIWDQINMLEIVGSQLYRNGIYLVAFSGILLVIVCFLSYVGASSLNRFFIIVACVFHIILAILLVIAAIIILLFDRQMDASAVKFMENSLTTTYNKTSLITKSWDEVQTRMRCCAVYDRGWLLYRDSFWSSQINLIMNFNSRLGDWNDMFVMVPESCCYQPIDGLTGWSSQKPRNVRQCQNFQFGPPRFQNGSHNDAIYYRGCFNATRSYIRNYSGYMAGLCFFTVLFVIVAVIASFFLLLPESSLKDD